MSDRGCENVKRAIYYLSDIKWAFHDILIDALYPVLMLTSRTVSVVCNDICIVYPYVLCKDLQVQTHHIQHGLLFFIPDVDTSESIFIIEPAQYNLMIKCITYSAKGTNGEKRLFQT